MIYSVKIRMHLIECLNLHYELCAVNMWNFGIFLLILCQFGWLQGVDIPQLEVLYYSSDPNIQWLPEKVSKLSDLKGHGAQLGKFQPREGDC